MSESILKALMQLFAIVATTDEVGLEGRDIVERFLRRQISISLIARYLETYDNFLDELKGKQADGRQKKRTSVNSVKVLRICTDINKELEQKQKIIVLLRLLEFVNSASALVTEQHLEFIKTVSDTFTIPESDYNNLLSIAHFSVVGEGFQSNDFLLIDGDQDIHHKYRHLYRENLSGKLIFLNINDPQILVFRYTGKEKITLDGREVHSNSIQVFEQGSVIRGARLNTIYYNDIIRIFLDLSENQHLTFEVDKLTYTFKKGKIGLHELSFTVTSKNLVAIMGNSGAGKTTLLSILNRTNQPGSGKIMINGTDIYSNKSLVNGLIGNIPQDDLLIEELSVYQNLFYSSKLFFGTLNDDEISAKVNNCLRSLGLYEIKDLLVGDPLNKFISGGQRKRLNIALELIREPEILFVDEPTSGLSSNDAEHVMDLLKQLTLGGKLIFVVIHQPSSEIFKLFDKLLLLDTGGYPVYFGNPVDALSYFKKQMHFADFERGECEECGNINTEDIFKIVEMKTVDEFGKATDTRKITSAEWYHLFKANFVPQLKSDSPLPRESGKIASGQEVKVSNKLRQFLVYFQRNFLARLNNRQYVTITLFEGPLLSAILGFALRYKNHNSEYLFGKNPNIPVYIFICTIVSLFLGLIVSADEIIQDKKILKRESNLQLSRHSYLLSKIAFLFLVSAIQTLLFLLAGNLLLGFRELYADYWLVLFSVSCFANLLGLNISSGLKTRVAVYVLIPFLVIPQIMLSGVLVKFRDLSPALQSETGAAPPIGNIMVARWAYEALSVDQFKNNKYEKDFFYLDEEISNCTYRKDYWLPLMKSQFEDVQKVLHEQKPSNNSLAHYSDFFKLELKQLHDDYPKIQYGNPEQFVLNDNYVSQFKHDLDSIGKFFIRRQSKAEAIKQNILEKKNNDMGVEKFNIYKESYSNGTLNDFVSNSGMSEQVIILNNRINRLYQPIFIESHQNSFSSASFYANMKSLAGLQTETIWFNIIIIWIMTIFLYITLYYDTLKNILERGN